MNDPWEGTVRAARFGAEAGKTNMIAKLDPILAMADEIDRLRKFEAQVLRCDQAITDHVQAAQTYILSYFGAEIQEGLLGKPPDPPDKPPAAAGEVTP